MARGVDRFAPVQAYDTFLETLVVAESTDIAAPELVLACLECGEDICAVEAGDSMLLLINTALHHECEPVSTS